MLIYAETDTGKAREINEDFYDISDINQNTKLCILADGMGGYNGGEIASKLATISAKEYIHNNFDKIQPEEKSILKLIEDAIEYANMIVYEKSKDEKDLDQMGTTFEICLIYNNIAYIGHIGDSRIYRIRKNKIEQITKDHSYVEKLIEDGTITKEEANSHPKKNMLMKALGCAPFVEPDIETQELLKDDVILICSDGLSNMIQQEEINNIVNENIEKCAKQLILKANNLGGYDNISVIIIYNN